MGYEQHRQAGSWGMLVGGIAVGLVLPAVGLAIIALIGVGVALWQNLDSVPQVAVVEQQAAVELHELDPRLNFEVKLDREGNASVDGEEIDLDELRARLAKLKDKTSNASLVRVNADPECPAKLLIPVLDVCEDVGGIDFRVTSSGDSAVRLTATVASYDLAAEWDHFDDGTFSVYDKLTLKVVAPEGHFGTTLSITVPPTELPEDSAFRTTGTRLTFTLRQSDVTRSGLAWGAIDNPTIEQ